MLYYPNFLFGPPKNSRINPCEGSRPTYKKAEYTPGRGVGWSGGRGTLLGIDCKLNIIIDCLGRTLCRLEPRRTRDKIKSTPQSLINHPRARGGGLNKLNFTLLTEYLFK